MVLYGADTDQLRQMAENYRNCAQRMLEASGRLTATVTSVTWDGPDADGFRGQWSDVAAQLRSTSELVTKRGATLDDDAAQQDMASSSFAERRADVIDFLGDLFGDDFEFLRSSHDIGSAIGRDDLAALIAAGPITPADFDKQRGEDNRKVEVTIKLPDGSEVTVSAKPDDTTTVSLDISPDFEQKTKVHGLDIKHEISIGREFEVEVNPDGTLTYTFTGTSRQTAEVGEKNKYVDVSLDTETTTESVYSVTVPPGTSVADAMQINPFNPESIPSDASVEFGDGVEAKTGLKVTGKYRGVHVGIGVSETVGADHTTVVSRDADGGLSVLTGPSVMVKNETGLSIGASDFRFSLDHGRTTEHGVMEYVEFSGNAEGNSAYTDMFSDGCPKDTSVDGVTDRYTQTHTSTVGESGIGFEIDDLLDAKHSQNVSANEVIHRSYPNGHEEWAQQILVNGESTGNSVYIHGGTGRETEYQMVLGDRPAGDDSGRGEAYWGSAHEGGDLVMTFTKEELAVMKDNHGEYFQRHYRTEAEYLAAMTATADEAGSVMDQFITHYNYRPLEGTMWDWENPIHPEIEVPGRLK